MGSSAAVPAGSGSGSCQSVEPFSTSETPAAPSPPQTPPPAEKIFQGKYFPVPDDPDIFGDGHSGYEQPQFPAPPKRPGSTSKMSMLEGPELPLRPAWVGGGGSLAIEARLIEPFNLRSLQQAATSFVELSRTWISERILITRQSLRQAHMRASGAYGLPASGGILNGAGALAPILSTLTFYGLSQGDEASRLEAACLGEKLGMALGVVLPLGYALLTRNFTAAAVGMARSMPAMIGLSASVMSIATPLLQNMGISEASHPLMNRVLSQAVPLSLGLISSPYLGSLRFSSGAAVMALGLGMSSVLPLLSNRSTS